MIYFYTLLIILIICLSIYLSNDAERTKTGLQSIAILIAFSKDFFIKNYKLKPIVKLINNPTRENSKRSVTINLKFTKNGYSTKLDNLRLFPRKLYIDKIWVNNTHVANLDTIIDDKSSDVKVNINISTKLKIPRWFIIKYDYNSNTGYKFIIITNKNEC